ncbi:hypothetical protein LOTGIDRAFT_235610 [Lottia gigantea]|uniref:Uncharacterized protein n=1 Tax=Lottia gigantea TaxID=225164 RepID=V4BAL3_LOTGI|nr:hypothetical protein LOTGIDRAFT_235610 [Lottia gigantea]ESO86014.1 hypothetical protein LOTGIDRAFT_235610 [Lottia gigantea]
MFAQCIALFLCSVGLPVTAVKNVGTVQNPANLQNYIVDLATGNLLPVQTSQPQGPNPVNNLGTTGTTTNGQSNYVVLNHAYLGKDPLRSNIFPQQALDNSILSTTNQLLPATNQPPAPVQNTVPQVQSTSKPLATQIANSNREPPKQSGGMTFTVATGPGTNSNFKTFGSPPLIIFAPQNPTPSIVTSTAVNTGNTGANTPTGTPAPIPGTNTVANPSTAPNPVPTTGGNNIFTTDPVPPSTNPVDPTPPSTNPVDPTPPSTNPVDPTPPSTNPVEPTPTSTHNPFVPNVPVTDPTFQSTGLPVILSTIADPMKSATGIPGLAPPGLTGEQLSQLLTSTKNPPTIFELQTGMPLNGGVLNQPTGTTTSTGAVVVDPSVINTPQPEPEPEPQTTTPTGVQPDPSASSTTATNQNQPNRNPFLPPFVPPFLGNLAPIDPSILSPLQPNAVGSGSVTSTSTPGTNGGSPSTNPGSATNAALLDQVTQRKESSTAALGNIRGLLSGMITRPTQRISLDNLLRAATTIQNLKDQVATAQSQKSISKVRSLIIEAARVANVKI